jgi:hypothetical protein
MTKEELENLAVSIENGLDEMNDDLHDRKIATGGLKDQKNILHGNYLTSQKIALGLIASNYERAKMLGKEIY